MSRHSHNRIIIRATRLERILKRAMRIALHGPIWYGTCTPEELRPFTHQFPLDGQYVNLILTRDKGMHSGGWFKNPDFDRCWHASLSFLHLDKTYAPMDKAISTEIVQILFHDKVRMMWIEGPFSEIGKQIQVYHYRLMCDENWMPIKPRGEVYSKEFTERGWKSYSEIHGHKPNMIMTP